MSIHFTKSAMTFSGSFSLGGILSDLWRIASTIRLPADFPGTTAGPLSPPLSIPDFESKSSLPLSFRDLTAFWEWQA